MAQFRYLGEEMIERPFVESYGPTTKIRVKGEGGPIEFDPPDGHSEFAGGPSGDVISTTDARAIRHLRADPRFEEI